MLNLFQESINPQPRSEEKENNSSGWFEVSMKPVQDLMQKWMDMSSAFFDQSMKSIAEAYPQQQELVNKMLGSVNLYQNLKSFWESLNTAIVGPDSDVTEFYDKCKKDYVQMLNHNILPLWPEQVQNLFKQSMEIHDMAEESSKNMFRPWLQTANELQALLHKSIGGDQEAYVEFNKLWQENFSASFGKIFSIPQFSMNREMMQKQMHSINALISYINTMNQFMGTMVKVNQQTLQKIIKEYQQMVVAGTNPKTYKEFYDYWWKTNEEAYLKVFATPEFSEVMGKALDAGVNFKKEFDGLVEKQLEFLPYPSRNDMDSVYKTLDSLKREIRSLKKEIAALKEGKAKNNQSKNN